MPSTKTPSQGPRESRLRRDQEDPNRKSECQGCGYVYGSTSGYSPLTRSERQFLTDRSYTIDTNVHGEEIARSNLPFKGLFNSAKFEFHRTHCRAKEGKP